jgi:hypothetical protein
MLGVAVVLGCGGLRASGADVKAAEVRGHVIGESTTDFLRLEPELAQEASVCRQGSSGHPDGDANESASAPDCAGLLAAFDRGQRAEISNSSAMEFVLDGGKLVRLTAFVDGAATAAAAEFAKQFGSPSRETAIPSRDNMGAKWKNHLFVWDTADASVTLYEDNDPSLQDRRPLLILESRTNDYSEYTVSVQQLATLSAGARPSTHPKKSLAR